MRRITIWALGFLVIGTAAFAGAQFFNPSGSFSQTYAVLMNLATGAPYDAAAPFPVSSTPAVGSNQKINIDQSTPGTTNGVQVNNFPTAGNSVANPIFSQVSNPSGAIVNGNPLASALPDSASVTSTLNATGNLPPFQMGGGYNTLHIAVTSAGTGNTMTAFSSEDGVNVSQLLCTRNDGLITGSWGYVAQFDCTTNSANIILGFTYGSGTFTYVYHYKAVSSPNINGATATTLRPYGTAGNLLTKRVFSTSSSTNATIIRTGVGAVYAYNLCNTGTTNAWINLFDSASAPTPGTTAVFAGPILIPFNSCVGGAIASFGMQFSNGIGYAITGAVGSNDATVLPSTAQVSGYIEYF